MCEILFLCKCKADFLNCARFANFLTAAEFIVREQLVFLKNPTSLTKGWLIYSCEKPFQLHHAVENMQKGSGSGILDPIIPEPETQASHNDLE